MTEELASLHKAFKEIIDQACQLITVGRTHQTSSIKKAVTKNFVILTGKQPCCSLSRCFPVENAKFLRTPTLKKVPYYQNRHKNKMF